MSVGPPGGKPTTMRIGFSREVVSRVDVSCAAKEEILERFESPGTRRVNDAAEGDLHRKALGSGYGHQLEMIGERPRPIGNEMVLSKAHVRVTAGDHLGHIAMSDPETAGKMLDLLCVESVGACLSDQPFDRGAIAGASSRLDRVSLSDASPGARHVGEAVNSEWIAFADKQRAAAIFRKVAGLRLEDS